MNGVPLSSKHGNPPMFYIVGRVIISNIYVPVTNVMFVISSTLKPLVVISIMNCYLNHLTRNMYLKR